MRRAVLVGRRVFGRKKPPTIPKRSISAQSPEAKSWHAVDILPGPLFCPEVKRLGGCRFLAGKAPRLPIPDCSTRWRCRCVYRHFLDRRLGPRRADERGRPALAWLSKNRRERRGRRADDGP